MEEKVTMNKMGIVPIPKILLTMGIPMIFSMVLQACYNIVDSIFVAGIPDQDGILHMGEKAMNALTLAFPVQMLIVALAIGTGVGVNALLARTLGQKDMEKVSRVAGNGVFLGFVIYAVFVLFGLFGVDLYLKTQTEDTVVLEMAGSYLRICSLLCVGNVMFAVYEKLLQSTGKAVFSTISQIGGALVNIVLDPILIYGLIGLPAMGVAGAAWATVIGQWVSMFLGAFLHYKKNHEVKSGLSYVKPNKRVIFEIYQIGFPAIIMQALMSFMTYGINIIFKVVSDGAVTAYGVFYKIQQFLFFAGFGLRDAITPIVSSYQPDDGTLYTGDSYYKSRFPFGRYQYCPSGCVSGTGLRNWFTGGITSQASCGGASTGVVICPDGKCIFYDLVCVPSCGGSSCRGGTSFSGVCP